MVFQDYKQMNRGDRETFLAKLCMERASISIFWHDADGQYLYVNDRACESLGYSKEELLNMSIIDINTAVSPENWPDKWKKLCRLRTANFESFHRRKDGTIFPIELTVNIIDIGDKTLAISFAQDITERKKNEKALRLTEFCFNKASVAILLSKKNGRIVDANEQACNYLGYSLEEMRNLSIFDIDQSVTKEEKTKLWRLIETKSVNTFETIHTRRDKSTFPVEVVSNFLDFEGKKYSISFCRDISRLKKEEEQNARLEAHLRQSQKMEAIGTLAGGIAHDFNNILAAISGYAQLTQMECSDNPKVLRNLDQLISASDRAKDLVGQILAFSRQSKSVKTAVNIGGVVQEAIKLIRATVPTTIEIQQEIQTNQGAVIADETQIHQVVMNLCTNAYQSMADEGGLLQIKLGSITIRIQDSPMFSGIQPGEYIKLAISDTGPGIDPNIIDRIFDPYFTTKQAGEGTGMGLSTVHGIVRDHGGSIKVYSEPGVGTTFQVLLPVADKVSEISLKAVESFPRGNECILLVDDEEPIIDIGKQFLTELGYTVEARASSIDAIEAFQAQPERYDLVISDMTMPKITGDKLAMKIKEIRPDTPIILCSGFSKTIDAVTLKIIGVKEVLMKPVTLDDMAHKVRKVLDENSDQSEHI
jgi:PAS domain S-box-containing protein